MKTHLPNNAFRIASTTKYLLEKEACVIATRHIKPGETIENLGGWCVPLSDKELQDMMKKEKDFSVIDGTQHCRTSLLTGPTRITNHSCDHNAKMEVMCEKFEIKVVATRHVLENEEITVSYGSDYFGSKNQDCRCEPCLKGRAAEPGDGELSGPGTQTTIDRGEGGRGKGRAMRRCRAATSRASFPDDAALGLKEAGHGLSR